MSKGFNWFAPTVVIPLPGATVPFIRPGKNVSAGTEPVLSASSRVRTNPNRTWLITLDEISRRCSAVKIWLFVLFVAGHRGMFAPLNGSNRSAMSDTYRAKYEVFGDNV